MLGLDLVTLTFAACCSWATSPLEYLLTTTRPGGVNEALLKPMKGRVVAVENGPAFSEAGMTDPADQIARPLAAALAERYGLQFEPGGAATADMLILGVHTLEWIVEPGLSDYHLRYRGEATLVDRRDGRRLGRAWCDRNAPTGKNSYSEAMSDRSALATTLRAAADSCLQQLRGSLIAEASPQ